MGQNSKLEKVVPQNIPQLPKSFHWADDVATRLVRQYPEKQKFTLASGITPSGQVHIGNFREVITVDLVRRALVRLGKEVRFIFSWDDYDVFRKVPENIPNSETLSAYLGKSITEVPDPYQDCEWGCTSYAQHHEQTFEKSLAQVGVYPEFIYQSKKYRDLDYASNIIFVLRARDKIKEILNRHRTKPLADDWWPISIYCSACGCNDTNNINFIDQVEEKNCLISYQCLKCNHTEETKILISPNLKLPWRVDWPMRWCYEQVDFEPGGKDHSSEGGSYDTAKLIVKELYDYTPPVYVPYDFVLLKGNKGKMSSSGGDVITLDELLEIYTPEIIRWIFASYRNNVDFSIAFDTDVIRVYEAYDRLERIYYGEEEISIKKKDKQLRIFELSQLETTEKAKKCPYQPSFRHLVNIVQIQQFNADRVVEYYQNEGEVVTSEDVDRVRNRIQRVTKWVKNYALEEFVFKLNTEPVEKDVNIPDKYYMAIDSLKKSLNSKESFKNDVEVSDYLYRLIKEFSLENIKFFELLYKRLINKRQGPKLGKFLKLIDLSQLNHIL